MDTLENLRQKSKYIVNQTESIETKVNQNENRINGKILAGQNAEFYDKLLKDNLINCEQDRNSADILQKVLKNDTSNYYTNGKLNQSVSLDETKHKFNNQKLEEFKNIVESSYQNHVLNKSENDLQLSRRLSVQSTNSFQAWNFSLNSLDESFKNSSVDLVSSEKNNGIEISKIDTLNNSILNCKIPYMSAYNIYEETENSNPLLDKIFDSLTQTKKLTSNGSSATNSPTSLSSAGSTKNVNEVITEEMTTYKMELKPPETPKTSNLQFRKNLLRKSLDSSKNFSSPNNQTELILSTKKSNEICFPFKTQESLGVEANLLDSKVTPREKSTNIFNHLGELSPDSDFVQDHSDEENTLDIFSDVDDQHEQKKNINLKIDLSLLNTSDEEDNVKHDFDKNISKYSGIKPLEYSFTSSSRHQIKPDIIPNLMLDQIDDDRSVSVTVSLAKSMCKEIDYKKEMEAIVSDEINELDSKLNSQKANKETINGDIKKQNTKAESLPSSTRKKILPPPTNSAQSIVNNPDKPNLYRSKTVIGSNREKESDLNEQFTNSKNVHIKSIDLFTKKSQQSNHELNSKPRKKFSKKRVPIWESSVLKRPDSASKPLFTQSSINSKRPVSAGLLTYSKLIEIETNIQNDNKFNDDTKINNYQRKIKDSNEKQTEKTEFLDSRIDWLNLPHEIWLRVLSFLKQHDLAKLGQTCKAFNDLCKDSSLWRKIEIKYEYNVKDEWLDWIGKRRPNELNIIQCSGHVSFNGITGMFKNIGENLQILNLSRCSNGSLSGDNFALQASIRCPNVTSLDLSWTLLSNQTLKLIVDSFKKIESINLSGCNMIKEDGFNQLLVKHGKSLKNLEISGCIHFSSDIIYNIGCHCREIEKLNISNCHRIRNESIIEACPQWIKLKYIDLRGIKNIKNNCISALVRKCPHLEGLSLGECVHIGDASMVEIATYRSEIKQLDLCNCKKISDASIRSMAGICSKLEFLNLKGTNLTDSGLITLSDSNFIKKVAELNLSFLPISEFVLLKILKNAENLKKIDLYGCYNIKHIEEIKESMGINDAIKRNLEINI